ncbi:MAG: aminotransferase class III-fold pyridoxal phosphate-dependent enzyme, partial [Candidatus Bathyarchaeota archaeon]
MNEKKIIEIEEKIMAQTFAKRNLTLVKGKGAIVWDIKNNEYIDCTGSYGVAIVGHCHPKVVNAV